MPTINNGLTMLQQMNMLLLLPLSLILLAILLVYVEVRQPKSTYNLRRVFESTKRQLLTYFSGLEIMGQVLERVISQSMPDFIELHKKLHNPPVDSRVEELANAARLIPRKMDFYRNYLPNTYRALKTNDMVLAQKEAFERKFVLIALGAFGANVLMKEKAYLLHKILSNNAVLWNLKTRKLIHVQKVSFPKVGGKLLKKMFLPQDIPEQERFVGQTYFIDTSNFRVFGQKLSKDFIDFLGYNSHSHLSEQKKVDVNLQKQIDIIQPSNEAVLQLLHLLSDSMRRLQYDCQKTRDFQKFSKESKANYFFALDIILALTKFLSQPSIDAEGFLRKDAIKRFNALCDLSEQATSRAEELKAAHESQVVHSKILEMGLEDEPRISAESSSEPINDTVRITAESVSKKSDPDTSLEALKSEIREELKESIRQELKSEIKADIKSYIRETPNAEGDSKQTNNRNLRVVK